MIVVRTMVVVRKAEKGAAGRVSWPVTERTWRVECEVCRRRALAPSVGAPPAPLDVSLAT